MSDDLIAQATAAVRTRSDAAPRLAIVLGSGLGGIGEALTEATAIPYDDLPGFPRTTVAGHAGRLLLGDMAGCPVAILQGRTHFYETQRSDGMAVPLRVLQALGADRLLLTNAAGSLHARMGPGSLMALSDHINFSGLNPLVGGHHPDRFVDMSAAYDAALREDLQRAAAASGLSLPEGIYAWFSGPSFETPAEIRAIRILGADAVGMSTVPECILARHAGLRVAAVSAIVNLAAGMDSTTLSHQHTIDVMATLAADVTRLIVAFAQTQVD